jgi:hypothetical protein
VEEEVARGRIGDDGSLVADDEIVELRLLEVRPHRSEHAPGDDDDVCAGRPRSGERVPRASVQRAVLADQRPVEIERESGYPPRESVRKGERYGVPPVDFTT